MALSYAFPNWNQEDVLPDMLFLYAKVDIQEFLLRKKSFLAEYCVPLREKMQEISQLIDGIRSGDCADFTKFKEILITLKAKAKILASISIDKLHATYFTTLQVEIDGALRTLRPDVLGPDPILAHLAPVPAFVSDAVAATTNPSYASWLDTKSYDYNMHPFITLVNLQKEQSLVTKQSMPAPRVMDRALGFGMTDDGDTQEYYGFEKQNIASIQQQAKWFADYFSMRTQPDRIVDDGLLKITPKNAFTSVLYRYTPWTGSPSSAFYPKWGIHGVYSFWKIWNGWRKDELQRLERP